jgi:Lar family restriction alleviation protein
MDWRNTYCEREMTQELKPCPFCGGKPFLKYGDGIVGISCPPDSACNKTGLCVAFSPEKEATAIAAWNSRALESRVLAERKEPVIIERPSRAISDKDRADFAKYEGMFKRAAHPTPDDAARYPHAAIGEALIATGLYDRMNDITGGDREARKLIEELIATVDPVLERWHQAAIDRAMQDKECGS